MSCGIMTVGSVGDPSLGVSTTVKSERVAMLMNGNWVSGVTGTGSVSGVVTGSTGES